MRLLLAALLGGLLAAPAPQNVRFAVPEGTVLRKTFDIGSKFVLEDMSMKVNGAIQPSADVGKKDLYARQDRRVVVLDRYVEAGQHRPEKLRRRYESLSGKKVDRMPLMQPGGKQKDSDLESTLEGCTVVFTWDGARKDFAARLVDGETRVPLDGLREDMDLRLFLPGKDVSEGDAWTVDAGLFDEIFTLGGSLGLENEEGSWFESQLAEILEGDIRVTYASLDDSGIANLAIRAELPFDGVVKDERSGAPMDCRGDVNMKGTLHWNVKAGHFQDFDLEADMDLSMHIDPKDPRARMEIEMEMTFDVKISGKAEQL